MSDRADRDRVIANANVTVALATQSRDERSRLGLPPTPEERAAARAAAHRIERRVRRAASRAAEARRQAASAPTQDRRRALEVEADFHDQVAAAQQAAARLFQRQAASRPD